MASPRRWAALAALVLVVAAGAFAAGRATRPEPESAAQPSAAPLSQSSVDVSIPALAVSKRVPALKEAPAEAPASAPSVAATEPTAPVGSPSTGSTGSTGGTTGGTTGGGGGSTSETPTVVGGGTD